MKFRSWLGLLPLAFLFGCGQMDTSSDPLVVGMELAYPPFEMTDEAGTPTGVSVDLARALGRHLGRPVEIRNVSFDGLIPALRTGSIDLVISSMTATDERRQAIAFSDPYVVTGLAMLTAAGRGVETIDDLNVPGRVVAVKLGTTGHVFARENLPEATLRVLEQENACVLEVAQGKADAFLYDQMSVFRNHQRHPDTTEVVLRAFQQEGWAVGLRKEDEALRREVNAFLEAFRADGGFDRLADTYLAEMRDAFAARDVPFIFGGADAGE